MVTCWSAKSVCAGERSVKYKTTINLACIKYPSRCKQAVNYLKKNNWKKLWPHQQTAVEKINGYIKKFSKKETNSSYVVALPTGTGKTGIICAVAHQHDGLVLIVSPRKTITDQNYLKIKGDFFTSLDISIPLKKTYKNFDSFKTKNSENAVIVSTIQMIDSVQKGKNKNISIQILKKKVKLLIVDEGHWEPAPTWQEFLRGFDCPKILFTATPIRNDYAEFDLEDGYMYSESLEKLQNQNYLKKVHFKEFDQFNNVKDFVDYCAGVLGDKKYVTGKFKKALIRCESASEVQLLADKLAKKFPEKKVIGIHERFKRNQSESEKGKGKATLVKHAPVSDADKEKYDIWIHQYKMIEGFDNPMFGYLFIYSPFKNVRMLVQQVGRVLRNPERLPGKSAYVFYPKFSKQEMLWDLFKKYDCLEQADKDLVLNTSGRKYSEKLIRKSEIAYLDKIFRTGFDPENKSLDDRFLLPLTCSIYKLQSAWSVQELRDIARHELKKDAEILFDESTKDTFLTLFLNIKNSPYLNFEYALESKTGIIYLRIVSGYLIFYSTSPKFEAYLVKRSIALPIERQMLDKLVSNDEKSKVVNIYLKNASSGKSVYSSKKLWARNIADVPEGLDDRFHAYSNLWGYSAEINTELDEMSAVGGISSDLEKKLVRRYIGYEGARVTQDGSVSYSLTQYNQWTTNILNILKGSGDENLLLNRYSKVVPYSGSAPYLIAFDFDSHEEFLSGKILDATDSVISEQQFSLLTSEAFEVKAGKVSINSEYLVINDIDLIWKPDTKKFLVSSENLSGYHLKSNDNETVNLIEFLNRIQGFKVYLEDGLIYLGSAFIKPTLVRGEMDEKSDVVLQSLSAESLFGTIDTEKGRADDRWPKNSWPSNSLFGLVSNSAAGTTLLKNEFKNVRYLICDDLGTECCDFLLETDDCISLFHAKAKRRNAKSCKMYGASAIHEAISQAKKNLSIINQVAPLAPSTRERWDKDWTLDGKVAARIRVGKKKNGEKIWQESLYKKIRNPSITKQVILLFSNCLSKSEFTKQLKNNKQEALHSYFLILSLINQAQQLGVKVKVFCDE